MQPYRIIAIESSPYSVKVRAVMRYRHLPYRWISQMTQLSEETAALRPALMPAVRFPDGDYHVDSSHIIAALEERHPGGRSVLPDQSALAFLAELIEDLADEWLTKCLFHYRFSSDKDARSGAGWVMDDAHDDADTAALNTLVEQFIRRQRARMPMVGCTPPNAPLLERSYLEVLGALEPWVASGRYLFGSRPSLADFALYGQLATLSVDPTPAAIMRERAPRTWRWVRRLDDASGVEGHWQQSGQPLSAAAGALLKLATGVYLPYLAANDVALAADTEVALSLDGMDYRQPPFRYHAKCLAQLRQRYAALDDPAQRFVAGQLGAGAVAILEPA